VSHEQFMRRALELAARGLEHGEQPIAALVVVGDEVVAESFWRGDAERGLLGHPELVALLEADRLVGRRQRDAVLYTTLEPCLMCMGASMAFFVCTIVYALASPLDGAASVASTWAPSDGHPDGRAPASYALPDVVGGVCAADARRLLEDYVARPGSTPVAEWTRMLLDRLG
jgi:tRNA(adenine34) deaminase